MSWNRSSMKPITLDEFDLLELDQSQLESAQKWNVLEETKEQFAKAKAMARQLILSGAVGNPTENKFYISLSGHANPGHKRSNQWANDGIGISISQATPE